MEITKEIYELYFTDFPYYVGAYSERGDFMVSLADYKYEGWIRINIDRTIYCGAVHNDTNKKSMMEGTPEECVKFLRTFFKGG